MKEISWKAPTLFRQMAIMICTTIEACTSPMRGGLCFWRSLLRSWSLVENVKGTPIYTWMNSARAELHLFSILHRRIKFHLPPHGKVRGENANIREAATETMFKS
ncbi:hypothetical protein AVEN_70618-1 [Araneus ventricosus]|uniref:Uncharacterized protein n=1 Tax=Araneus ventricosus TaxID=182803 RepID=A0A4Y2CGX3_ARAVE|nr:hypothetical protein AVEN_70618-1 [Araneus ventricosus]